MLNGGFPHQDAEQMRHHASVPGELLAEWLAGADSVVDLYQQE